MTEVTAVTEVAEVTDRGDRGGRGRRSKGRMGASWVQGLPAARGRGGRENDQGPEHCLGHR